MGKKITKGIASVYLLLLVVLQPVLPFIEYAVFQDFIAENLCVNRFEEESCCKGKCFLEDQLKEANNQKPESSTPRNSLRSEPLFSQMAEEKTDGHPCTFIIPYAEEIEHSYRFLFLTSVFHPPQHI